MTVGKLRSILAKAIEALDDISTLPLHIAGAPGNTRIARYDIAGVTQRDGALTITLAPTQTVCKALMPAETAQSIKRPTCCA